MCGARLARGRGVSRPPAVAPGEVLREALEERHMSGAEFARRMGLSQKHVSRIMTAKAGFSPTVAVGMERVLGISAAIWLRLQADYELSKLLRSLGTK